MRSKKQKLKLDLLSGIYAFSKKMNPPQPNNPIQVKLKRAILVNQLYQLAFENDYFMVSVDLIEKPIPETKKGGKND